MFSTSDRAIAADLAKRLGFYKLRAKVTIEDLIRDARGRRRMGWSPAACGRRSASSPGSAPAALGWRAIVAAQDAPELRRGYGGGLSRPPHRARRAGRRQGFPRSATTFPHEALMDQLRGVDFDKGCYVGQEVVSRMQHRGTARTRIVPARLSWRRRCRRGGRRHGRREGARQDRDRRDGTRAC